jgi:hypothetical protein
LADVRCGRHVNHGNRPSTPSTDELRAPRRLQREQEPKAPFVFTSERGTPFTTAGFARMVERAGSVAKFGFKAHPHMLRHACGYALANKGHDTRALQAYPGYAIPKCRRRDLRISGDVNGPLSRQQDLPRKKCRRFLSQPHRSNTSWAERALALAISARLKERQYRPVSRSWDGSLRPFGSTLAS